MKSSLPFTSVVSYHTNPLTCGVAKFSAELAKRLGVPFVGFDFSDHDGGGHPLFSLKWSEICGSDEIEVFGVTATVESCDAYSLFWHDKGDLRVIDNMGDRARHVFYADPSLGSPGLWCPSLITPRKRPVRLFSFGMAHKLQTDKYKRVRELLDAASMPYHLRVSVGLHEGTSLDGAEKHFDALKKIMGEENVTILGILSDDAVVEELANADYVLAFFEKGLRANNTTVHAALDAAKYVITNWDAETPEILTRNTVNINGMGCWHVGPRWSSSDLFTWDNLLMEMDRLCLTQKSGV